MDDLVGRLIAFGAGCFVGGVAAALVFIITLLRQVLTRVEDIKEEVDEVLECERNKGEEGLLERRWAIIIAYTFSMLLVLYAAWGTYKTGDELEQELEARTAAVCKANQDVRLVQRALVDQIYLLATSAIDPERIRPGEIPSVNAYIDRVNEFRNTMYDTIKPTPTCQPYVTDTEVDPPTKDYPQLPIKRKP